MSALPRATHQPLAPERARETDGALRLNASSSAGLAPAQLAELERARRLSRPLRRGARVASMSAWSTIALGVAGAPFAIADLKTLALALALIALGYHELCARRALFRFDISAPRRLALSQLMLMGVLIGYAGINIYDLTPITIPDARLDSALSPAGEIDPASLEALSSALSLGMYAALIVGTILFQGSTALYYILKRRPLRRFLASTPPWVVETMRTLRAL